MIQDLDLGEIKRDLRQSVHDLQLRGLVHSSKWSAEQLISFPQSTIQPRILDQTIVSDVYLYAKSLFDLREYRRCCSILENQQDLESKFLGLYAEYLYIESSTQYQNELLNKGRKINKDLSLLATKLEDLEFKDEYLFYLLGVVFGRLGNMDKSRQYLMQSISLNPMIWSCWQELGKSCNNQEDVLKLLKELKPTFAADMFKIHVQLLIDYE